MAVILASVGARAQAFKDGNIFYALTTVNNETVAMVYLDIEKYQKGEGTYSGNLVIPESVKYEGQTYPVYGATEVTFLYCYDLKSLSIPKTVRSSFNFKDCRNLTKVEIAKDNPYILIENNVIYTKNKDYICGALPAMVKGHLNVPEGVRDIFFMENCTGLTSISLPASLSNYTPEYFSGCDNLTSITVAEGNEIYASIQGFLTHKGEGDLLSAPQGLAGDVVIPSEFSGIGGNAFIGCNKLKSVTIPANIKWVSDQIFTNCSSLETINVDSPNLSIPYNIANGCSNFTAINVGDDNSKYSSEGGLLYEKFIPGEDRRIVLVPNGIKGKLIIPEGVDCIRGNAFYQCINLTTLDLPKSLNNLYYYKSSYGTTYAFNGMPALEKLIIRSSLTTDSYKNLTQLESGKVIVYAPYRDIERIKQTYKGTVLPIDMPYTITDFKTYIKGVSFKLAKTEGVEAPAEPLKVVINGKEITPDANGLYFCTGLNDNTKYNIEITGCEPYSFTTLPIATYFTRVCTQTTITIKGLEISSDETFKFEKYGFTFNGKDYDFNGKEIKLTGLKTGGTYSTTPYVYQNGTKITLPAQNLTTQSINIGIRSANIGPTSVDLTGSCTPGDAKVSKMYFTNGTTQFEGKELTYTGLDPNTKYTIYFKIECEDGYSTSKSVTITTKALELKTLQPKGVSPTCSIVAASTNMSSEETGAGFQWRKYDAPSSLKSSEGFAAIFDGQLEGYLKNLQSTSYYNVRAFYKSATDKYYYGDWVTFDPSDFSFFEPTVHTYATTDITHNMATVRGYVLAGTDNIISQGFEYWSASNQNRVKAFASVNNDNIQTVLSNGQVMTATLSGLEPDTEYFYRAFVTTSAGTKYGEEQTFTTPNDPSGAESVVVDNDRTVVGYYDINGRRYEEPQHGFNIVVYSDGTTEKVVVRK